MYAVFKLWKSILKFDFLVNLLKGFTYRLLYLLPSALPSILALSAAVHDIVQ